MGRRSRATAGAVVVVAILTAAVAGGCGRKAERPAAEEQAASFPGGGGGATAQGGAQAQVRVEQASAAPGSSAGLLDMPRPEPAGVAVPRYDAAGVAALLAGRKLVRNADLEIEVVDLDAALGRIEAIAAATGGIITASNISSAPDSPDGKPRPLEEGEGRSGPPRNGNMTLRVPVARFDEALAAVRRVGRLVRESVSTQDVTGQYVDLEARVTSLEEQERRLRALVGQSGKLDDLLRLENELARVRGEIDSLRGQLRALKDQADFSTIDLFLRETVLASGRVEAPRGVWERAARAFVRAANAVLQAGAGLVVAVAAVLPVAAAVAGPAAGGWLAYRALRRRTRGGEAPTA